MNGEIRQRAVRNSRNRHDAETRAIYDERALFRFKMMQKRRIASAANGDRVAFLFELYQRILSPVELKKDHLPELIVNEAQIFAM
jgi:hypothetical protein